MITGRLLFYEGMSVSISSAASASGNRCSICFDDIASNKAYKTKCNHVFHFKCIRILKVSSSCEGQLTRCPLCRQALEDKDEEIPIDAQPYTMTRYRFIVQSYAECEGLVHLRCNKKTQRIPNSIFKMSIYCDGVRQIKNDDEFIEIHQHRAFKHF